MIQRRRREGVTFPFPKQHLPQRTRKHKEVTKSIHQGHFVDIQIKLCFHTIYVLEDKLAVILFSFL